MYIYIYIHMGDDLGLHYPDLGDSHDSYAFGPLWCNSWPHHETSSAT